MNRYFCVLLLLYGPFAFGQTNCAIDFAPGSNEMVYNQAAVDAILQLSNYDAFFLGESHTDDFEPEFKYNFIRHLNSGYGVRDVFMEVGYAAAYFFNQYLQTGDTSVFQKNNLLYWRRGYKNFWKKLYAYNWTLPDSLTIVIHGIDFERTEIFALLETTRSKNEVTPDYLQQSFNDILSLTYGNRFWEDQKSQDVLVSIRTAFSQHTEDFRRLYGANFGLVQKALLNKVPATTKVVPRNKIWYQNLKEIVSENKIKKFIGFFGGAHTPYSSATSLTVALKKADFFKGNILNIATMYTHMLSPKTPLSVTEYNFGEKEVVDAFYNKKCRAVIVKSSDVPKTSFKTASDYILFARENVTE